MSENVFEKRSIIVVGKTGAGKSKLLNEILDKTIFKTSASIESCTSKVESSGYKNVKYKFEDEDKNSHEQSFDLNAFDTQGLADSEGRSEEFLNEIAQTIKKTPLNLIVVLVEYGELYTGVYANLGLLRECLNGMSQYSCILILNKVPTEKILENKRRKGEQCRDRKETLEEYFNEVSKVLNILFKYKCFLEDESLEGAEQFNTNVYNFIRRILFTRKVLR